MTEYIATPENVTYGFGASGSPTAVVGTIPPSGRINFDLSSTFSDPNIIGMKVVLDADGTGDLFFLLEADNPGWPAHPTWTADPFSGHITLQNSYATPGSYIHVAGPTHYEYTFFAPGDPMFGGFTFNDYLADFLISLATGSGGSANWAFGELRGLFDNAGTVTVSRFDVVFFTLNNPPPLRRYPPVNNGGSGPTRHYPRTVNRRAGGTY